MEDFVNETAQTNFAILPIGTSQRDVEALIRMNAEQFGVLYPKIAYRKLDRQETKVDDLYNESIGNPVYSRAVMVPALILHGVQEKLLKRYGIEVEHQAGCLFSNRVNEAADITPQTGDLVEYLGINFEILTVKHTDYVTNTQIPLNLIATMKQVSPR